MAAELPSGCGDRWRDGVSQLMRIKAALQPGHVAVDERSLQDLLAFVRDYSRELRYFDGNDQESGDWQAFFPQNVTLDEMLVFIQNPDSLPENKTPACRQPHFVLLLSFLQLLDYARQRLNDLTRRHLDFHFRQFLHMQEKKALPDHVNVLVELAKHTDALLLPAGTRLYAGKDSTGNILAYQTDEDAQINQAQVARLSTLYVDKRITGIREARESLLAEQGDSENVQQAAFLLMLGIVLGQPSPGDALPKYPDPAIAGAKEINYPLLEALYKQLAFVHDSLKMPFSRLDELIKLKNQREPGDASGNDALRKQFDDDWGLINSTLERAGQLKRNDDAYKLPNKNEHGDPIRVDDFSQHFLAALGVDPYTKDTFFGLPDISTINELYQHKNEPQVRDFIQARLKPLLDVAGDANFDSMMQTKIRIDGEWDYIDAILETASGKKPKFNPLPSFSDKLKATLGLDASNLADSIGDLDELYASIQAMQAYFYLSAYEIYSILTVANNQQANSADWNRVYNTLASAYKEKTFHERQQRLKQEISANTGNSVIIESMLALVLDSADKTTLNDLRSLTTPSDLDYLMEINDKTATVSEAEWDKVCHILTLAWRNREGHDPVAEQEDWQGLYAAEDATAVLSPTPVGTGDTTQRWKTFGQFLPATDKRKPAEFGLAISSPVLLLSQGERTITLTFEFANGVPAPMTQDELGKVFHIMASTEKGWMDANNPTIEQKEGTLLFTIPFTSDQDVLAMPKSGLPEGAEWPVLKITFDDRNEEDGSSKRYQQLKALLVSSVKIDVNASRLSDFPIWNDLQKLDSTKPFQPFGPRPTTGSRFYMAVPELSVKKLSALRLNITWVNLEVLTDDYYANYPAAPKKETFKITIGKDDSPIRDAELFIEQPMLLNQPLENPKVIYWELQDPDFQHTVYPTLAASKAIEMAAAIANKKAADTINAKDYVVNPPYTPVIKKLTLGYTASSPDIKMQDYLNSNREDRIFHIQPFGYAEIQPDEKAGNCPFLPQFDNEGELYIGLEKLKPPQQLNLLFQMAEGSADADLTPATVHWDYLSDNRWQSLENGNILGDGTRGLINSGIMTFSLPAAAPNTLLPPEWYWLRASIRKHANSVCDAVAIHTQAVAATFADNNGASGNLNQTLASETIKKLVNPLPGIKAIHQPYTSFGGKSAEQDQWFYTRVSERLRHKQRALTPWDYEHLALERFPQIYKAKCIPSPLLQADDQPGKVEVIVIPDIRNRLPANPFEPKAPVNLLADIQQYLQGMAPDSAAILVRNAHYVAFKIRMGVRFYQGYDEGYCKKRLNEGLNRFLAPWAYTEGADIVLGGKLYANSIINFVERLPYVDYIAQISFFGTGISIEGNGESIGATNPSDVLVPEPEHIFDLIPESGYAKESFYGINYMRIGLDFIVG
jgi:hypothetical protein